jgi:hypothetical protein
MTIYGNKIPFAIGAHKKFWHLGKKNRDTFSDAPCHGIPILLLTRKSAAVNSAKLH